MNRLTFWYIFLYLWIQIHSATGTGIILQFEPDRRISEKTFHVISEKLQSRILYLDQIYLLKEKRNIIIKVHLVKYRADWEKLFRKHTFVEWSSGVAFTGSNEIFILMEQENLDNILETFTHEVIHILNHEKWKDIDLPVWFDEGLAQYFSGKTLPMSDQVFLSNFIIINKLLPFNTIDSLYYLHEKRAHLGYLESYLAIKHFDDILGKGSLKKILAKNPVGFKDFNNYFYSIFKISVEGFESKFFTLIKRKYKYLFILNLENVLFALSVLFLFFAYWWIRRRNKQRIAEMEDELPEEGGW